MADPILIIGAGPTGLMAANELARRGTPVEIVDAGQGPTPEHESRALGLHARSLDLLQRAGLEAETLAAGNKAQCIELNLDGRLLANIDFAAAGTERPYLLVIPQGTTERILLEDLRRRGVEVRWQTRCTNLENPDAPRVTLQSAGADPEMREPACVIGADGGHSIVRTSIGAGFDGETAPETFGLVDVRLQQAIDPTRLVIDRRRTHILARIPITDRIVRYISNRPDVGETLRESPGIEEIIWRSTFRIAYRHVNTFQSGRVFLMGDAAHLHSPAGARGMNLGLEDAAWFAHAHEHGLLDGFTAARMPYAKATLAISKRMMNSVINNNVFADTAFRYLVPAALKLGFVRRYATRLILAEELPRPPFDA